MGLIDLNEAYLGYLKTCIDIKTGKLNINENNNGVNTSYLLIDCNGKVHGEYSKIIDLKENGFICFKDKSMFLLSTNGEVISSLEDVVDVEVFDTYFRCLPRGEFYSYKKGPINTFIPGVVDIFYNDENLINVIKFVKDNKEVYSYFNNSGIMFDNALFDFATPFYNGISTVSKNGHYYAIDHTGDNIFDHTFVYLGSFEEGLAPFSMDGKKYGFIDSVGTIVIEAKYKVANNFDKGVASVVPFGMFKHNEILIDTVGNEVKVFSNDNYLMIIENGYYRFFDKFNARYIGIKYPIIRDCCDFTICQSNEGIVLFNKRNGDYLTLINGLTNNLKIFDRLIVVGDFVYYFDINGNLYNMTGYFNIDDIISVGGYINGNNSFLSFDMFKNDEKLLKESEERFTKSVEALENEEIKLDNQGFSYEPEVVDNSMFLDSVQLIHSKILEEKEKFNNSKNEIVKAIEELNNKLRVIEKEKHCTMKIDESILFVEVDGHKEINKELLDDLAYLDLSNINFDNVKVAGIDFSNTNISIDPQTVYNKDLSNGNYNGIRFLTNNFMGVNTDNASFKNCDVPFNEFEIAELL